MTWKCSRCGRTVTAGIAVSFDPRYATGLCSHGSKVQDKEPDRVALAAEAVVDAVIEERRHRRAVKRADAKVAAERPLSKAEEAALRRRDRERAERVSSTPVQAHQSAEGNP